MAIPTHIVSTKILSPQLTEYVEHSGIALTQHNFIQTTIDVSERLEVNQFRKYIVLTSKTAVNAWMMLSKKYEINLADHFIFCTDQGTLHEVLANALPVKASASNASALADAILAMKEVKAVTFICSNIRRDELPVKLKGNGVDVIEVVGYHTLATPIKISEPYHSALFFSPSGVESFVSLNKVSPICFCIGETTAACAISNGFKEVHTSDRSTPESLIEKVILYYSKNPVHAEK